MTKKSKIALSVASGLLLIVGVFAFMCALDIRNAMYNSSYDAPTASYMTDFYAGKKVLLIVPHEDDEMNVGSGILEQYSQNGSDVRIVWVTNGDAYGGGERRINEAILAMARLGIPEENMIFLGYGDSWDVGDYNHIYHMEADMPAVSACRRTQTYGTKEHPDYHTKKYGESALYTRGNLKSDLTEQITDFFPDVIYAVDCDEHPDHRAVSLLSEEVIGDVLRDYPDYEPSVFKGFGYCTAWDCVRDYYADNVASTQNPSSGDEMDLRPQYRWSDRVRLPVAASTLGLTMRSSSAFSVLQAHESQDALHNFSCIINSDKVFWERRTDSLLYEAKIEATSGDYAVVNDFKLSDSNNVTREKIKWKKGIWAPDAADPDKKLTAVLDVPCEISEIVVYDSPYMDNHIKNAVIQFSDGTEIETGPLLDNGSPTVIRPESVKRVDGFTFSITDWNGEEPGIMEIEAFGPKARPVHTDILKITADDNYAYEYTVQKKVPVKLGFNAYPSVPKEATVTFYEDGRELGSVEEGECIEYIPDGKRHLIRAVLSSDDSVYDEIALRTLSPYDRLKIRLARYAEQLR